MTPASMQPGDRVTFREPARARDHGLPEGAQGRLVEIMALTGEGERAVVEFADGRVLTGIPIEILQLSDR